MLAVGAGARAAPWASKSAVAYLHTSSLVESKRFQRIGKGPEYLPQRKPRSVAANIASAGPKFLFSGSALLRVLRNKQVKYRTKDSDSILLVERDRQLAESEIRWLFEHVCNKTLSEKQEDIDLSREQRRSLIHLATQMTRKDVPLAYLLGTMPFGSLPEPLLVRKPILIPRPETEHWVTEAANLIVTRLKASPKRPTNLRIADLCTGSGCVALLFAHILRTRIGEDGWTIIACDRSPEAVKLAQDNRDRLGFSSSQIQIYQSDIFSDTDMMMLTEHAGGKFDVILSNPPYIPRQEWEKLSPSVKLHEDPAALIGEQDIRTAPAEHEDPVKKGGMEFHRRLAELAFSRWFSTLPLAAQDLPYTPRLLVAEYGKEQWNSAHQLYSFFSPPCQRLPTIVKLPERLFICGIGNARTHPLTRHSIGQVVLEPLLEKLVEADHKQRKRLAETYARLDNASQRQISDARFDPDRVEGWSDPLPDRYPVVQILPQYKRAWDRNERPIESPTDFPIEEQRKPAFDVETDFQPITLLGRYKKRTDHPSELKTTLGPDKGGWTATIPLMVPCSSDRFIVYQLDVVLYKPSPAMNRSGIALKAFLESQPRPQEAVSEVDNFLILQDELDLDFGEVRTRDKGSARGHKGIRNIFERLKLSLTQGGPKLTRICIGIGRPLTSSYNNSSSREDRYKGRADSDIFHWVLSPLTELEMESVCEGDVLNEVSDRTLHWIRERVRTFAPDLESLRRQPEFVDHLSFQNQKDQFGAYRTVWVEK